jgi:NTE family protein
MSFRPLDWLRSAPFTLSMSAGFFGFYAHAGFVAALDHFGLRPARITGSSAGALIGTCHAAGLDAAALTELLHALRRDHFWDPSFGRGLLRGQRLHTFLADRLPARRFDELATPLTVSAWDLDQRRTVTLSAGDLVTAARASAAFPLLFQPVTLDGLRLLDGGILDRPGLQATHEGERVLYHHLKPDSPWRRANSPTVDISPRAGLLQVCAGRLPRLGPYRMEEGPPTTTLVRERTIRWLESGTIEGDGAFCRLPAPRVRA